MPAPLEPWYAALDLTADSATPVHARDWADACAARAGVAPQHRPAVRRVATELAREAALRAADGDVVRVEIDVVGPVVRLSARGPAGTQRLGSRAVEALRAAVEWGVQRAAGNTRLVWCHVEVA
ncbi:hypothetical protein [Cellulomonas sp. Marseille-Q8402]